MSKLFQYSSIVSLASKNYNGEIKYEELMKHGNFGLGTFNRLDGEMIALNNRFYKMRSDGSVKIVEKNETSPFASVMEFVVDKKIELKKVKNKEELISFISKFAEKHNQNILALKIYGYFDIVNTRTVSMVEEPFPSLQDAAAKQKKFNIKNKNGFFIGYFTPKYLNTIGVEGMHIHFISDDLSSGGHAIDFENGQNLDIEISLIDEIKIILGENNIDERDFQDDIKKVEN